MIERAAINLKSESTSRSNLDKSKNKQKNLKTNDSFEKALSKLDKTRETRGEDSSKKLEENQKEETKKQVNEEVPKNQQSKEEKNGEIVEVVSFLNIKDLPKESNNIKIPGENLKEIKIQQNNTKIENLQINQEESSKGAKEKILLKNVKEIKGDEKLILKDLEGFKKSDNDKKSDIKLEDIKSSEESSEKKKVEIFKDESSQNKDFKEDLNKKLETLKEKISLIDDKKEKKETTFSENLKNNIEGTKENYNKEKTITAAGKSTEKSLASEENIIDQMAKNITTGKTDKGNFIKIQLKPEVLGEMTVKLTEGKEGMIATISAEKEVVKNVLRNSGEQITTILAEKNIKISNVVIETNESEKQDLNLFSDNSQEDFTGEGQREESFSERIFSSFKGEKELNSNPKTSDEIYSGKGINFYV